MVTQTSPNFKTPHKAIVIKAEWHWQKTRWINQWNKMKSPKQTQTSIVNCSLTQEQRLFNGERMVFTTHGTRTIGHLYTKQYFKYIHPILWPPDAELIYWKRLWGWESLKSGGEGDDRGWDGWIASLAWWTWVWANSGSWWWTGKPGGFSPWDCKKLDMTEWLNWTDTKQWI